MRRSLFLCLGCLISLWACQEERVSPDTGQQLRELSFEEQELIRASNAFAFSLTREVADLQEDNIFLSPYHVNRALSMPLNAAENKTLAQMQQALHCEVLNRLEVNKVFSELNPLLHSIDPQVNFVSAQGLWHQQDVSLRPLFRDMMIAYYGAGVEPLDADGRKAASHVSKWVEEHTAGRLNFGLPPLTAHHRLLLVSATHFKARWTFPFAKESTAPGTFFREDGRELIVPMMFTDQATYRYYQDARKTLVDIPFGNQQYSMTVLMPQQQDSLSGLLAHISQGSLEQDLKTADTLNYHLYLPRFSINQHSPMKAALAQMGIEDAFSFRADFSGMLGDSLRLPLAQVVHHAGIELNESGVRSAVPRAAAALDRSNSPVVRINRSFVFFIREKHTGLILYSGVYHGIEADN